MLRNSIATGGTLAENKSRDELRGTSGSTQIIRVSLPFLIAILSVSAATAGLSLVTYIVPINLVPIVYLIPVVVCATRWGIWPAITAAIASAAAADFFFFEPYYTFVIYDPQEVVDLLLFLFVAFISSNLAGRLRREADTLRRREIEIRYLYDFSRRLAACFTVSDLVSAIQKFVSDTLDQHIVFIPTPESGIDSTAGDTIPDAVTREAIAMVETGEINMRTISPSSAQELWLLQAVSSATVNYGVIAINIGSGTRHATSLKAQRIQKILSDAISTLKRIDIGNALDEAKLRLQSELLKDAFHGTISHELRTPLASISGSASVLQKLPAIHDDARARQLVDAILDDTCELNNFTGNLINASRLTANGIEPQLEWIDPRDVVNAAIQRRERRLSKHKTILTFADDLPMVRANSALLEEAYGQLLENAAKYSPSGSRIYITIRYGRHQVILSVRDNGTGLTADEKVRLGQKSFRGPRHLSSLPGSGLGFWIATTFVKANGGRIEMFSGGEGLGTTASIILPIEHNKHFSPEETSYEQIQ